jgi:hypothetical protein
MLAAVHEILGRCGTARSVLPPTELFNEGWMLRLVLDWFDRNRQAQHELSFEPDATWYSEALLPSRFLPLARSDSLAESFTHADGVTGHIRVQSGVRGDASLLPGPKQFVVTEAKLSSTLSAGTKNAPSYDQAARNVACIAFMLGEASVKPESLSRLAFYVLAPQKQIDSGIFGALVSKESIRSKVAARVASYGERHQEWFGSVFVPTLERIEVEALSWESVLVPIARSPEGSAFQEFYARCLEFNPGRAQGAG